MERRTRWVGRGWRRAVLGAATGVVGLGIPSIADAQEPVRHALVIGANDGGGTLTPLRYGERDAEQFARVLSELGGFSEEKVTVLYQPDQDTMRQALAHHAAIAEAAPDDLFVIYYSGHADAHGLRLGSDTYWYDSLKHDIRQIDATARVGILDACRSGTITRLKGAKVAPSLFAGQDRLAATGEAWMTATSADELAQESEALRGGFFTHYLISGLRGAADTGDGLVDVNELYSYTFDRVVARTGQAGGTQHPHFDVNLSGSQGLALTDVRQATATMILDGGAPGSVAVLRMNDRTQLAEVQVPEGRDVRLALPAGRYLVRRRRGDRLYEAQIFLNTGVPVEVTGWQVINAEQAGSRGEVSSSLDGFQARVRDYRSKSAAFVEDLNLDDSPTVAGSLSVLVPGGGQLYNRQYGKGIGYFLGTAVLVGGGTLFSVSGEELGAGGSGAGGGAAALGFALWGASVADAVYNVRRNEDERPRTGGAIGWSTGFSADKRTHTGLMLELTPVEHLSIGLDRTGFTWYQGGGWDVHVGSRLIGALEGKRFRPGVFASYGLRLGRPDAELPIELRGVLGFGLLVRYHVTPRYFIEIDARAERDGATDLGVVGVGMGIPIGRGGE